MSIHDQWIWRNTVMTLDEIIESKTATSEFTRIKLYCQNKETADQVRAYLCIVGVDFRVYDQFTDVPEDTFIDTIQHIHIVQYIGRTQSLLDWLKEQP